MANMFAFAESRGGALRKVALEAVSAARQAADATGGGEVHALLIGAPGIGAKAAALGRAGADLVIVVEHAGLARYSPEVFAATAAERLRSGGYRGAFFAASAEGRDLAPRVAVALGVSMASDADRVRVRGRRARGHAPDLHREDHHDGAAHRQRRPLLSLRPGAVLGDGRRSHGAGGAGRRPRSIRRRRGSSSRASAARATRKLDLADAPVVVSGGRGLREAANFKLVEELAAAFGNAAVGATRAVTDDGWRDPHRPDRADRAHREPGPLCGGAASPARSSTWPACARRKTIVAINKDKDAPIFKLADYGIVGDLFEIVPRLTEAVKKARAGH